MRNWRNGLAASLLEGFDCADDLVLPLLLTAVTNLALKYVRATMVDASLPPMFHNASK